MVQIGCDRCCKKEHLLHRVVKLSLSVAFVTIPLYCYFVYWQKSELFYIWLVKSVLKENVFGLQLNFSYPLK